MAGMSETGYAIVKSCSVLSALVGLILLAAVIFMGMEGHHFLLRNLYLLREQVQFNATYSKHRSLTYDAFYDKASRVAVLECQLAKIDLTSWNNKTYFDANWFSFSIVSTLGWGIYYPKSSTSKVICLVYALFGIPLFASVVGAVMRLVYNKEGSSKRSEAIRRYCINRRVFGGILATIFIAYLVLGGYAIQKYVNWNYSVSVPGMHEEHEPTSLGDKVAAAGHPKSWTLTQGIYYQWINGFSLIGFGDFWPYDNHGTEFPLIKCCVALFNFCIIIVVLANVTRAFEYLSSNFEASVDRNIVRTYAIRKPLLNQSNT